MAYLYLLMVVWEVLQFFWPANTGWRRETGTFEVAYEIPPRGPVSSAHAIRTWFPNFEYTGSALKKKPSVRVLSVHFPENIDAEAFVISLLLLLPLRKHLLCAFRSLILLCGMSPPLYVK
jgi:hypothetical protein